MRKSMEAIGLATMAVLYWITWSALHGPNPLPDRIPVHFDINGNPNGWGPPNTLLLLPAVATGVFLLMTVLASIRFRRFNLPVRVTEANLPFIQDETSTMIAWIKFEMVCLFTYLQWGIVQAARAAEFRLSPLIVPVFMVVVFGTVGWRLTIVIRGAKSRAASPDPFDRPQDFR